jgi:1-deoxy-D-xylulose-5-phosphate synthase
LRHVGPGRLPRSASGLAEWVSMNNILQTIHSPADIKKLTIPQLTQLAEEIRERLIVGVSKTGGHIGPNLGVVELTLAMHYVFDTPKDSFVFDVSH